MARLGVNNHITDPFPIHWGTRQGCPLSPLLFALAIERLAALLRQHTSIRGCRIGTLEEKTSLYAYDMLLYLADDDTSLSTALETIAHFGHFSSFRVNWSKSVIFPFDPQYTPELPPSITLQVVAKFRYLGVEVQQPVQCYVINNISPLIQRLKHTLVTWTKLPLNLLGRINIFKMIYLPCFLYLFWQAPVYLPKKLFWRLMPFSSLFCGVRALLEFLWIH